MSEETLTLEQANRGLPEGYTLLAILEGYGINTRHAYYELRKGHKVVATVDDLSKGVTLAYEHVAFWRRPAPDSESPQPDEPTDVRDVDTRHAEAHAAWCRALDEQKRVRRKTKAARLAMRKANLALEQAYLALEEVSMERANQRRMENEK